MELDDKLKQPMYDQGIKANFSAKMPQTLDDREIIEQLIDQHIVGQKKVNWAPCPKEQTHDEE